VCFQLTKSFFYQHTNVTLSYNISETDRFQLYFDNGKEYPFDEIHSVVQETVGGNVMVFRELRFEIPYKYNHALRFDIGDGQNSKIELAYIKIENFYGSKILYPEEILKFFTFENILSVNTENNRLVIVTDNPDTYFYATALNFHLRVKLLFVLCVSVFTVLIFCLLSAIYKMTSVRTFIKELYTNRRLIFSMAMNDFKTKYAGSYMGIIWAFIQPIVTVVVYTLVFTLGFRAGSMNGMPFVNWLCAGILPWYFFSDALINGTNSLIEYSYLVKKVVFNINILMIVKVLSSFFVHLVFILIVLLLFLITGHLPNIYWFQLIYYCACTFFLSLGFSYFFGSIVLFFKDINQFINVILQIGIWATPIMWMSEIVPEKYLWVFKINPMFYVVQGYRNSLIHKTWFWEPFVWTLTFLVGLVIVNMMGMIVFRKLKPHFADVI
jgi:teichoic acid transport system permease protein